MTSTRINIDELYSQIQIHGTLIVTCNLSAVSEVKKKLSRKKYKTQRSLDDFSEGGERLSFKVIREWKEGADEIAKCKLRITLSESSTVEIEGIDSIEVAPNPLVD